MSSSSSSWTSSFFASCAAGAEVLARQHLREKLREHRVNRAAGALHQRVEVRGTHLCFGILKDERRIRQEEFIAHRGSQIARSHRSHRRSTTKALLSGEPLSQN